MSYVVLYVVDVLLLCCCSFSRALHLGSDRLLRRTVFVEYSLPNCRRPQYYFFQELLDAVDEVPLSNCARIAGKDELQSGIPVGGTLVRFWVLQLVQQDFLPVEPLAALLSH